MYNDFLYLQYPHYYHYHLTNIPLTKTFGDHYDSNTPKAHKHDGDLARVGNSVLKRLVRPSWR